MESMIGMLTSQAAVWSASFAVDLPALVVHSRCRLPLQYSRRTPDCFESPHSLVAPGDHSAGRAPMAGGYSLPVGVGAPSGGFHGDAQAASQQPVVGAELG